jgi:IS30 family transposase
MHISHETIYRSLYVQSRGELRRELTAQLRSGRSTRRSRGRSELRGRIVGMVSIAERPPEVDDRRVPGHWEGDLIMGAAGKTAIATLVERQTRYVLLARLGTDRTPASKSTSATRTHPGNAAATKTPTGCSGNTSHAAPT